MFLCRKCILRQVSDLVRISQRYESSALPRLNKGSRVEEIIILETPRSTRRPKKVTKKRSLDVQRRLLDEYEQNQKITQSDKNDAQDTLVTTIAGADEVNSYLDRLSDQYSGNVLTPIKYGKLEKELRSGFTSKQMREYLLAKNIPIGQRDKRRLSTIVLEDVFKVARKEFVVSSVQTDVIQLTNPTLYFLLANAGSTLQKWVEDFPGKLDVDKKNGTLTVTANSTNRRKIRKLSEAFTRSIGSQVLSSDIPAIWKVDKEIMKVTNTFIVQEEDHRLRVHFREDEDMAVVKAERHIRASLPLYNQKTIISMEAEDVPVVKRPIYAMHTPIVERQFFWTRHTRNVTGVQLPFYYLTSQDPKPLKAVQVNARPRREAFDTSFTSLSGQSIRDVISTNRENDRIIIRFGHVLEDTSAGVSTFNTNIAGQFFALKDLVPSPTTVEQYQLVLQRPGVSDTVLVTLSTDIAESPPAYTVVKQGSQETWLQLPSQTSDLEISSITSGLLESSSSLDDLLVASNLRDDEYLLTVDYNDETWNVYHQRLSTLWFSLPGVEDPSAGRIEWRKVRSRESGEQRQEIRINCDKSVPTERICEAMTEIMQALHKQSY